MHVHRWLLGMAGAALACGALVATAQSAPAPGKAVTIYTSDQAAEGARLYTVRCAMCHGQMLEGTLETPALTGKFIANWAHGPVGDLFDYIGRAMPQFAPGSLTPKEDAAIVAYLLQQNGASAGTTPLPDDAAKLRTVEFPTKKNAF